MKIDKNKMAAAIAVECANVAATSETAPALVKAFQKNALEGRYEDAVGLHQRFLAHLQMPQHEEVRASLQRVYDRAASGEFNAPDGE